jgi:hypothetical protein
MGSLAGVKRIAALCGLAAGLSGLASHAHAQSVGRPAPRSDSATLHISVMVVAIVQTPTQRRATQSPGTITYNLEPAAPLMDENYEIRSLPAKEHTRKTQPAGVLETLVVVPR